MCPVFLILWLWKLVAASGQLFYATDIRKRVGFNSRLCIKRQGGKHEYKYTFISTTKIIITNCVIGLCCAIFLCKNIRNWQQSHFFCNFQITSDLSLSRKIVYRRIIFAMILKEPEKSKLDISITIMWSDLRSIFFRRKISSDLKDIIWKVYKMKSFLFLIFLQISRAIMDNLEDLRIIDTLLQEYDRRATPTNRMGRL